MRIKRAVNAQKKRRKIMRQAKGYFGSKSTLYRIAKTQLLKSGHYAYVGRKQRKRDFRKLWIARINAGARLNGLSYSKLIHGLKLADVNLNRKMLSEIAINDSVAFASLCERAKAGLASK